MTNDLDQAEKVLRSQIAEAKHLVASRAAGIPIEDFDIRGSLYATAMNLAPMARQSDIDSMREWLRLSGHEHVIDIAAGGGFLTKHIQTWTTGAVTAVDTSRRQLEHLTLACGTSVRVLVGSPDDPSVMSALPDRSVDVATSFGGIHHVQNQRAMMAEVARVLRTGGRFVGADVGANTSLSRHFDDVTAHKSLTGHQATWLSTTRLSELTQNLPLCVARSETVPLQWEFKSEREMALFFMGLHAYDLPMSEILSDLSNVLGYEKRGGLYRLNWGMLFFELIRS